MGFLDPKFYRRAHYLGGFSIGIQRPIAGYFQADKTGCKFIYQTALNITNQKLEFRWNEVSSVWIEGESAVQKRVTATRIVLLGPLAWAAKKVDNESFVTIKTLTCGEGVIRVKASIQECQVQLKPFIPSALLPPASISASVAPPAPATPGFDTTGLAAELERLSRLHRSGALTDEEFTSAKGHLLGRI